MASEDKIVSGDQELDTPLIAVDLDLLERNIAEMAALAAGHGVSLRPHAKTHKSPRIARMQLEAGPAMELVLGTMPWLVLAGLVEGFVTGRVGNLPTAIATGAGLGAVFWGLVAWRGRSEPGAGLGLEVGAHAGGGQPARGRFEHARAGTL